MRFDPILLSRAWQSVAAAEGTDKEQPAHYRTITMELHRDGVFLVATDTSNLLHAWVPNISHTIYDGAPDPGEDPEEVIIARDLGHRALAMLAYVGKQASDEDVDPADWAVDIDIDDIDTGRALTLAGMEARTCTVSAAGEQVTLSEWDAPPVPWRDLLTRPTRQHTSATCLPPSALTRLVKATKPHEGALISASFSGLNKPILVEIVNSEPYVSGVVMPARIAVDDDVEVA